MPASPSVAWTIAALPNAIAFGLVATVTTEVFTGGDGMGQLLTVSLDTANASLTFAVVGILTIAGVVLVLASTWAAHALVPWSTRPQR